jgi:plasmid stability protein
MATLTIKNIPDALVRRLKAQAARNRRSLNSEVIDVLASVGHAAPVDIEALLARARATRAIPETAKISSRQLKTWKGAGRL